MAARRHHAVPRFYLPRFAGDDDLLWLHDIHEGRAVQVRPDDAAVEKYLYAPGVGENPRDDSLERILAEHVDGPAVGPLEKLAQGGALDENERARIAIFVAFQEYRIPRMRDAVASFVADVGDGILKTSAQRPEYMRRTLREQGHDMSDEEVEKLVRAIKEDELVAEPTKVAWLAGMSVATEIADLLYRMPWTVVIAPVGIEFLTSDAPVVKVVTDPRVPRMLAGGWLSPSAEATFALDPETCLVIRPDGVEGRVRVKKRWCRVVNGRVISKSRRFVFSRSRDAFVEKLAAKRGEANSS